MIDLTVLVVSFNTRELLLTCLESVDRSQQSLPHLEIEVILVDNGSRDGSADAAKRAYPKTRLTACVRNRGFAAAVNTGLRMRRGRHVLLLNSDAEMGPDLIEHGISIFDQRSDVGVVGPSLVHSDGRSQRSVHAIPGLQTEFLPSFLLKILRPKGSDWRRGRHHGIDPTAIRHVEALRGAVLFLRGELIDALGLFDEGYFFFLEETEYCARVRAAGFEVGHAHGMQAVHHLGASSKRPAPLATRIEFHRSLYRFLESHSGAWVAWLSRGLRTLRGVLLIFGMGAAYVLSRDVRRRLPERWGLLMWHLQGCPAEPRFVDALSAISTGGLLGASDAESEQEREERPRVKLADPERMQVIKK